MDDQRETTIRRLVQDQMEAWGRGDAEGYASTAGDDLGFTNIIGRRWVGRAAFVTVHEKRFADIFAGSHLEAEVERISFPGQGVAVAESFLHLTGAKGLPRGIAGNADGSLHTRLLEVFELRDGTWTLIICHNTAAA